MLASQRFTSRGWPGEKECEFGGAASSKTGSGSQTWGVLGGPNCCGRGRTADSSLIPRLRKGKKCCPEPWLPKAEQDIAGIRILGIRILESQKGPK